jgi:hypothetical protein
LTVGDTAADLDLPASTVSSAFRKLTETPTSGIKSEVGRGAYSYRGRATRREPERPKTITIGTLLECVGFTDTGDPVIRDEENVTYIARLTK